MHLTYAPLIYLMQIISFANGYRFMYENNMTPPKFLVNMEPTKANIYIKDLDKIHVVVRASYNNSSPVNGMVFFDLYIKQDYNPYEEIHKFYENIDIVDGKAEYDFDIKDLAYSFQKYQNIEKIIKIVATVTDNKNFEINYGLAEVTVNSNRFNLNRCLSNFSCSYFIDNVEQDVVYQITHVNGSYVNDINSTVELTYSDIFQNNERQYEPHLPVSGNRPLTFRGHMNETGHVQFKVVLPDLEEYKGYTRYFAKKLKYLDEESTFTLVNRLF